MHQLLINTILLWRLPLGMGDCFGLDCCNCRTNCVTNSACSSQSTPEISPKVLALGLVSPVIHRELSILDGSIACVNQTVPQTLQMPWLAS